MLCLTESRTIVRAFKDLTIEVNGGLEPWRVIGTFPNASVGWEIEAAPLCQLLKLVLVHFPLTLSLKKKYFSPGNGRRKQIGSADFRG